ncbi:ergothioneine biosynthesis protein EgtB [Pseudomonas sp. CR3202]|uniref:ergothioneine biosynthesis protein EgtB n=1 Tax=Pseudomonas sp. CR3202 TaxID=3351532 RepID=UPI003BEF6306
MNSTALLDQYLQVRRHSESLVASLSEEDMVVQSMPDASPAKWHLAHTTWFFETFLLRERLPGYPVFDPGFAYLFNSYYEALGPRQPRPERGLLTRPPLERVLAYRRHVDEHMQVLLRDAPEEVLLLVELGLAHEEQHQELLLMDLLHLFSRSPLRPAYNVRWRDPGGDRPGRFVGLPGGLEDIGHDGEGFAFDNEGPRHKVYLQPFQICDRLVTNAQWLEFIEAGGYGRADLWLSEGWARVQEDGWQAPMYWQQRDGDWMEMGLGGLHPLVLAAPVTHISFYEACAFAAWADARLPTEAEWEVAARAGVLGQVEGCAWQWTASAYAPYPGFRPSRDAVGEYNGKFMVSQMVLRGGASITPAGHARPSYRNFFYPAQRWMFSGLRLARDAVTGQTVGDHETFAEDVRAGLSAPAKSLPPKYFYDAVGSELFEAICNTREYYPTRTETALLRSIAAELSTVIPQGAALVEFGSGASLKTRLLLDAAPQIGLYLPIDISESALRKATAMLQGAYPDLRVLPQVGDFTHLPHLPAEAARRPRVAFFPGSTLGNFTLEESRRFLRSVRRYLGRDSRFILGLDMQKDVATLEAAYDDADGITEQFNKNLLARINRELGGDFDLDAFDHLARWNPERSCMEIFLVSRRNQKVHAAGRTFEFRAGERLHTENSHKYSLAQVADLAAESGWHLGRQWLSPDPQVGIFVLEA